MFLLVIRVSFENVFVVRSLASSRRPVSCCLPFGVGRFDFLGCCDYLWMWCLDLGLLVAVL